ncbi:MAG: arginine--tRNA ligase, partial [Deltaproteobacteria bacterium]|nr:arginine--tRNA ligase [Deltaproteobacteria bacterium]
MRTVVQQIVTETLDSCLKKGLFSVTENPLFVIEKPKTREHGDYATNVAFEIGRRTKQRPQEV